MTLVQIAFRNVFRNKRRSLITVSAIGVGALSVLIVGALLTFIVLNFQSSVVRHIGHLTVYKAGYVEYGSGDPSQYGIRHYRAATSLIAHDPVLKPLIRVITPVQDVVGLAGNFQAARSTPFFGVGVDAAQAGLMNEWDDYGLGTGGRGRSPLPPSRTAAVVGFGLARILAICKPLHIHNCHTQRPAPARGSSGTADPMITGLSKVNPAASAAGPRREASKAVLDLLAATAGGSPNVVSVDVSRGQRQADRDVDDHYVMMHLGLAQELMYGKGVHEVTGIELQLYHTRDMARARARLEELFARHHLDFEVRDFAELTPLYPQVLHFFQFIFGFISIVLAVIVVFMIINTMTMAVLERTNEIGTLRALGLQRTRVRLQFSLEGLLLGMIGATGGAVLAELLAVLANVSHLRWTPPTASGTAPLRLLIPFWMLMGTWLVLIALASLAAVVAASRANRMTVVEALRHV